MKDRFLRHGPKVVGAALVVLVLYLVGWNDRVTDPAGVEHTGRLIERGDGFARLETDDGIERVPVESETDVRTGLGTAVRNLAKRPGPALVGIALQLIGVLLTFVRWLVLLRGAGSPTRVQTAFRVGFVGLLFQNLLPGGAAGGDVMRAVYIARHHPERKTRAIVSIFADRAIGLGVLCCIAAGAVLFAPSGSTLESARSVIFGLLAVGFGGLTVIAIGPVRRLLRIETLWRRLPFPHIREEIVEAMALYRRHLLVIGTAVGLSFVGHGFFLAAFYSYGLALGAELPFLAIGVAIPVAQMISAVPGLPGGWGVGDAAFYFFLSASGVAPGTAVALSFTFRIVAILLSLPGGLWLSKARAEAVGEPDANAGA